jgi:hypothetical protein
MVDQPMAEEQEQLNDFYNNNSTHVTDFLEILSNPANFDAMKELETLVEPPSSEDVTTASNLNAPIDEDDKLETDASQEVQAQEAGNPPNAATSTKQ